MYELELFGDVGIEIVKGFEAEGKYDVSFCEDRGNASIYGIEEEELDAVREKVSAMGYTDEGWLFCDDGSSEYGIPEYVGTIDFYRKEV